jgi:hypothetical protein
MLYPGYPQPNGSGLSVNVNANFAIRGFCPNVLALKAVLMILDLPGPQRRMANRQRAHRHRIIADMSLVGRHSPILSTGDSRPMHSFRVLGGLEDRRSLKTALSETSTELSDNPTLQEVQSQLSG